MPKEHQTLTARLKETTLKMAFFDEKITVILGAGSSAEVGMPVGNELKSKIASLLEVTGESRTDSISKGILANKWTANWVLDQDKYFLACHQIATAMPQAISIDNYLHAHKNDKRTLLAGKLAISEAILNAERASSVYWEPNSNTGFDFKRSSASWYNIFFQLLTENCSIENLPESLSNVSIISFNYDRSLEHYLICALKNYYRLRDEQAIEIMGNLEIHHPYGQVGFLPWQNSNPHAHFGAEPTPQLLEAISGQIRTFTEGTDPDNSNIDQIRESLALSNKMIFLGFAFHPMNMQLLATNEDFNKTKTCFGTALGISEPDCKIIEREIQDLVIPDIKPIYLRNDLTCSQLLAEYRRSLTSTYDLAFETSVL